MKAMINNMEVEVAKGFFVIESNKGNHSGFNRTWKQWNKTYATRAEARRDMANTANKENGAKPGMRGLAGYCRLTEDSAWVDSATYAVVDEKELIDTIKGTATNLANIHAITILEESVYED
jgi:hypothetical protein